MLSFAVALILGASQAMAAPASCCVVVDLPSMTTVSLAAQTSLADCKATAPAPDKIGVYYTGQTCAAYMSMGFKPGVAVPYNLKNLLGPDTMQNTLTYPVNFKVNRPGGSSDNTIKAGDTYASRKGTNMCGITLDCETKKFGMNYDGVIGACSLSLKYKNNTSYWVKLTLSPTSGGIGTSSYVAPGGTYCQFSGWMVDFSTLQAQGIVAKGTDLNLDSSYTAPDAAATCSASQTVTAADYGAAISAFSSADACMKIGGPDAVLPIDVGSGKWMVRCLCPQFTCP